MITVRAFYEKTGRVKYISHLDMNRCMQRVLRQTKLPIWYTEGFNPHAYVTFALPLSLGYESLCESMDFRLMQEVPFDEVARRMNRFLPEGLRVTRVGEPQLDPSQVTEAEYQLSFFSPDPGEVQAAFGALLARPELPVEKKSKKGLLTVDIKPWVQLREQRVEDGCFVVALRLPAGSSNNLNPSLLLGLFAECCPVELVRVVKTRLLGPDGKDFA